MVCSRFERALGSGWVRGKLVRFTCVALAVVPGVALAKGPIISGGGLLEVAWALVLAWL